MSQDDPAMVFKSQCAISNGDCITSYSRSYTGVYCRLGSPIQLPNEYSLFSLLADVGSIISSLLRI